MKESLYRRSNLITIVIACLGLVIFSTSTRTSSNSPQKITRHEKQLIKIKNATQGLSLINLERPAPDRIRLILRNDYDKRITAYKLALGSTTIAPDYNFSEIDDDGILPGATQEVLEPSNPELYKEGIIILAVIFEDGTSDGHKQAIKEMEEYRSGSRKQVARILHLFRKAMDSNEQELLTVLEQAKASILSSSEDDNLPKYTRWGYKDMRRIILRDLERIKNDNSPKTKLAKFVKHYEKI